MTFDITPRQSACESCEHHKFGDLCGKWEGHWPRPEIYSRPNIFNPDASCPIGKWGPIEEEGQSPRIRTQQPKIDSLIAITSINPDESRIARQQECIKSWQMMGLSVVAVQHKHEIKKLSQHFPGVEFIKAKRSHVSKKSVYINDMVDALIRKKTPALLINSDIEIRGTQEEFLDQWTPQENSLTIGVRMNHGSGMEVSRESAGLDVFLLTPEMAETLPDTDFVIGIPWWDYWIPHHFKKLGHEINVLSESRLFWHLRHDIGWSKSDWRYGRDLMRKTYKLKGLDMVSFRETLQEDGDISMDRLIIPTAIFIKTWPQDHPWLAYCLRSIKKFATGFEQIVIVADESSRDDLKNFSLTAEDVFFVPDPEPGHGYIQQQMVKMQADQYTNCEYILFMDSDCIFTKPVTPKTFFRDGCPLWMKGRYGTVGSAKQWKPITEEALGGTVEWEYMRRQPFLIHRGTPERLREAYPQMLTNMESMTGLGFSEFNVMGAFAERDHPEVYTFIDHEKEAPERFVNQYYSWGGLTQEIRDEMESILS